MSIFWAYDEDGGLSSLPASPFLLPAILALVLIGHTKIKFKRVPINISILEHERRKKRMEYLLPRRSSGEATISELVELNRLEYPAGSDGYYPVRYV